MDRINVTHNGPIALVTLNRPKQNNAMSLAMWQGLATIFAELKNEPDTRVVILHGAGTSFCAGADISEFGKLRSSPENLGVYQRAVDDCIEAITSINKPTIAAITGYCLGGGCGLATACDFRLGDKSAQFGIPAAKLSIVYGTSETENLLSVVGLPNAKRILFMAERMDVDQAREMGLVDEIADDVMALANQWATTMSELAPLSIAGAKSLLNAFAKGDRGLSEADTSALIRHASLSEDYAEGRAAYAEKRAPIFKNR